MDEEYAKKTCPRCGERLYADMQVCYGCLYDFTRSDNGPSELAGDLDEPDGMDGPDGPGTVAGEVPAPLPGDLGSSTAPALGADAAVSGGDEEGGKGREAPRGLEAEDPRARAARPRSLRAGARPRPAIPDAALSSAAARGVAAPRSREPCAATGKAVPVGVSEDVEVTTVLGGGAAASLGHVRVAGPGLDVLVPMGTDGIAVGRGSGNQVVIHDKAVSRRHLRLMPAPCGVEALDLGATNPARFRGAPIKGSAFIGWGESLQVGEVSFSPGE